MKKDLIKRTIFAALALAIFIPLLVIGGLWLQIAMGLLAMLGVHELLQMKGLNTMTPEGLLTLLATFAMTIPLENYLTFLPVDGNVVAYGVVIFIMNYTIEDAAFPIAMSFYVGFGFNALVDARIAGLDKALLALCIVWATDSGAYLVGMNFGKRRLAPRVSPNKSIEGAFGGILAAMLVTLVFMLVDSTVALPYGIYKMTLFAIFFSIAGQLGDLIESAMKRHFGVKDSGKFIPGHGGVLDRFDSMLAVFPIMHLFGLF